MIVYGFGDYFTDCLNTLTGDNFRAFNQGDNWKSIRRPLQAPVSGASGAYDVSGEYRWPQEPLVVATEADIMHSSWSSAGAFAEDLVRNLWKKAQSKLWLIRDTNSTTSKYAYRKPAPPDMYFPASHTLSGVIYEAAVGVNAAVWLLDTDYQVLDSMTATGGGNYAFSVPTGTYRVKAMYYDAAEMVASRYYWATSAATNVSGATSLDVTITSAVPAAQAAPAACWAWAKVLSAQVITAVRPKNPRSVKIAAEFEIPEGIFYNADVKTETRTEAGSKAYTLYNTGSHPTHVKWTLGALTHTITDFMVDNETSTSVVKWSGTLTAGTSLVLDSSTYTATAAGGAAYSGITAALVAHAVDEIGWCVLSPGANSLTISLTQATTEDYTVTYEYYDAEVL